MVLKNSSATISLDATRALEETVGSVHGAIGKILVIVQGSMRLTRRLGTVTVEEGGLKRSPPRKGTLTKAKKQHRTKQNDDDEKMKIQTKTIAIEKGKAPEPVKKSTIRTKKTKAASAGTEDLESDDIAAEPKTFYQE